jgi:hypothetical protein
MSHAILWNINVSKGIKKNIFYGIVESTLLYACLALALKMEVLLYSEIPVESKGFRRWCYYCFWTCILKTREQNLGFEVLTAVVMKSAIFWDITPSSPFSVNRRFGATYRLHLQGRKNKLSKKPAWKQVANFLAKLIFSILKMEAICSSETRVDTERTTRRYIAEDGILLREHDVSENGSVSVPSLTWGFRNVAFSSI